MSAAGSSSAIPPGTCGIHGYHGRTQCPSCSTSALPFTPIISPLLNEPDAVALAELVALRATVERQREALEAIDTSSALPEGFDAAEWWKHVASRRREIARAALEGEDSE